MTYLFGDTDVAAERLRLLAEIFAPPTEKFLSGLRLEAPGVALDLGCGQGYTTHLLAKLLRCDRTIGLDNSEHFISLARRMESPALSFYQHDVTTTPFPFAPVDIIYLRFLLTHLREHRKLVADWASQLRTGGLLIAEETEWIHTTHPAFKMYITIVENMLGAQGNMLYVGKSLDGMGGIDGLKQRVNQVAPVAVRNSLAAKNFLLNMQSLKGHSFVRENYQPEEIALLERNLRTIEDEAGAKSEIEWRIRQVVFQWDV